MSVLFRALAIEGYMSEQELLWLAAAAERARVVVEVGSYKGRSTRALGDNCMGTVYAVDPWDGGYRNDDGSQAAWLDTKGARRAFEENLSDLIGAGRVVPIAMHFSSAANLLLDLRQPPDFVFIDGDHREDAVREDIQIARQLMRGGGLLAGHDYGHKTWPGVRRVVDALFPDAELCGSIWSVRL